MRNAVRAESNRNAIRCPLFDKELFEAGLSGSSLSGVCVSDIKSTTLFVRRFNVNGVISTFLKIKLNNNEYRSLIK